MLLTPSAVPVLMLVLVLMPVLLFVVLLILVLVLLLMLVLLDEIDVEPPTALLATQSSRTAVIGNLMVHLRHGVKEKRGVSPFLY